MVIAGSIIGGNILNIEEILKLTSESAIDWIHLDVMDGNFVPNLTLGLDFLRKIRNSTNLPIDLHLMVSKPEDFVNYSLYCDMIDFHIETTNFPFRLIDSFKSVNSSIKVGVAVNPVTDISFIQFLEGFIDNVLIMTVEPGFAGQKFIPNILPKIEKVKNIVSNWSKKPFISVDGGINSENLKLVLEKGANFVVCASYLYQDYSQTKQKVLHLKEIAKNF